MEDLSEESVSTSLPTRIIENLRLLRKESKLCDFTIEVEDVQFRVHQTLLAACSDYFRAMLTSDSKEAKQGRVVIQDINATTMGAVLDFFYSSKVNLSNSNVQEILFAASFFQIAPLVDISVEFIKQRVEVDNCVGVLNVADRCNLEDLRKQALCYCLEEFEKVVDNEEFLELDEDILVEIISSPELDVSDESQVFQSIVRWVDADPDRRKPKLLKLLSCIRFIYLKPHTLVEISSHSYIRESDLCRDLLEDAKNDLILHSQLAVDYTKFDSRAREPQRLKQRIYALGGWTNDYRPIEKMEVYNPYSDTWVEGPPMSTARCGVGAAILGDYLYAVGGHDGEAYLNSVERFDIRTGIWHQDVKPMFKARSSVGVVALNGYLYTFGGQSSTEPISDVERYDPIRNTWERLVPMREKRLGAGVAVVNGLIYVVGGCTEPNRILDSVEVYNPVEDNWKILPYPLQISRKHLGCAAYNGSVYAVGGRGDYGELDSVERYHVSTHEWQEVPQMSKARSGIGLVTLDDKLYAIGGHNGDLRLNTMEVYDCKRKEWSLKTSMLFERLGGGYAVYSGMKTRLKQN